MGMHYRLEKLFWISTVVLIVLVGTVTLARAQEAPENHGASSARLGDLQVSITSAEPISSEFAGPFLTAARTGYYFVAVKLEVRNLSAYHDCTELSPALETSPGGRYTPVTGVGLSWPQSFNLAPGKQSQGTYIFQVKEGDRPTALVLFRDPTAEDLCATAQGRSVIRPGRTQLRLALGEASEENSVPVSRTAMTSEMKRP